MGLVVQGMKQKKKGVNPRPRGAVMKDRERKVRANGQVKNRTGSEGARQSKKEIEKDVLNSRQGGRKERGTSEKEMTD